jgi:hypothetical protein
MQCDRFTERLGNAGVVHGNPQADKNPPGLFAPEYTEDDIGVLHHAPRLLMAGHGQLQHRPLSGC